MKTQAFTLVVLFIFSVITGFSQVTINDDGTPTPDESAILDLSSANKGLLLPRMVITDVDSDTDPVESPATGLLIFNTGSVDVPAGFYAWDGALWVMIMDTKTPLPSGSFDVVAGELFEDGIGTGGTEILFEFAMTPYGWVTAGAGLTMGSMTTDVADPDADKLIIGESGVYRVTLTSSHKAGDGWVGSGEEVVAAIYHTPSGGSPAATHLKFRTHIWLHEVFFPSATGSAQGYLSLGAGDAIDVRWMSDADNSGITVFNLSLTAEKIGEL